MFGLIWFIVLRFNLDEVCLLVGGCCIGFWYLCMLDYSGGCLRCCWVILLLFVLLVGCSVVLGVDFDVVFV